MNRRSPAAWAVPAVLVLVAGFACDGPGLPELPVVPVDELSLTVLSSHDEALWDVRDVVDAGNTLWALTASPPFVHGFGPTGELTARFGSAGEGPGEFRFPSAVWLGHAQGSLTVWDPGSLAAHTFSQSGALLSSTGTPRLGAIRSDIRTVTFGDPFRAVRVPGGIVTARYESGVNHAGDLWNGDLVRVPDDGAEPTVLFDFADELAGTEERSAATLLVPVPLWDGCPDGRIAVLDPVARKLLMLDPAAGSRQEIVLPWHPGELDDEARLAYMVARIRAEVGDEGTPEDEIQSYAAAAVRDGETMFPRAEPLAVDLKCAPGQVWLQEFHATSHPLGFGPFWRAVALSGESVTFSRVILPQGFHPHSISESRAIGVVADPMGLQRVATVSLPQFSRQGPVPINPARKTLADEGGGTNP